jgi:hypothetical protein
MGGRVDLRKPQDPKAPIMIMQSDGLLDIVQEGKSWPIMTEDQAKLLNRDSSQHLLASLVPRRTRSVHATGKSR